MILQVLQTDVYRPLDVFEDFRIDYTHQYDVAKDLNGNKIPYTNKFKIPLTQRNRNLLGIPNDISLPKAQNIFGRVEQRDGTPVFDCVYQVISQTVNVLEPYIEIQMFDKLSFAVGELSKGTMSEMLTGDGTTFHLYDTWLYEPYDNIIYPDTAPFSFPFINWNNKDATFAYDPMRDLNQLQPTFYVGHLIKMIFAYVGIDVQSEFLFEDNQLGDGIVAEQLGLMLPCRFYTDDTSDFSVNAACNTLDDNYYYVERSLEGQLTPIPTCPRIVTADFTTFIPNNRMNWIEYVEASTGYLATNYSSEFCSMVDGEIDITATAIASPNKLVYKIGGMYDTIISVESRWGNLMVSEVSSNFGTMEVWLVAADFSALDALPPEGSEDYNSLEAVGTTNYDFERGQRVGTAVYIGVERDYIWDTSMAATFELTIDTDVKTTIDAAANQSIELAYVIRPSEGQTCEGNFNYEETGVNHQSEYKLSFTSAGTLLFEKIWANEDREDRWNKYSVSCEHAEEARQSLSFSYTGPTEFPPLTYKDSLGASWVPDTLVNLSESYRAASVDYKLLDIVKLVMARFNLSMYTLADGTIHIDTPENRSEGIFEIEHLIDKQVTVEYRYSELGLLSMRDDNPSYYPANYNSLVKYVYNEDKKDETSVSFDSCVLRNEGMFADGYDDSGYGLLFAINDSNYWGISDRDQAPVDSHKATFTLLKKETTPVMFPINDNMKRIVKWFIHPDSTYDTVSGFAAGFINTFQETPAVTNQEAVNALDTYTLESFWEDNEIRNTYSTYMMQWRQRVYDLMDSASVSISLDAFVSEENFPRLTKFPVVKYKGADWNLKSFSDFPFSSENGGIVNVDVTKVDILPPPTELPLPPEGLTPITLNGLGTASSGESCESIDNPQPKFHNGVNIYPIAGNTIYDDVNGDVIFDGGNLWYYVNDSFTEILINGTVQETFDCPPPIWKESRISTDRKSSAIAWCGINPDLEDTVVVFFDGLYDIPVQYDYLYTDEELTQPVVGQLQWYKTLDDDNTSYQINTEGQIWEIDTCVDRTVFRLADSQFDDVSSTCSQSILDRVLWHDGSGARPSSFDTVYEDDGTTYDGLNKWHKLDNADLISIDSNGVVVSISACP